MNGGGLNSNAEPATTPVYSFTNGGWATGTPNVYTPTSGNPSLTVTVGDWANVFIDGATTPVYIGRVTAVSATTISISATVKVGTAPTTAGTGISINVGGAWAGPSGAVKFPFTFIAGTVTNAAGDVARVNFKNDQTYSITAQILHSTTGPNVYQGYTTTFGDLGKATIDGGTSGASYFLLSFNGSAGMQFIADFIFQNNGATGSANGLEGVGTETGAAWRVVVKNVRGAGFNNATTLHECEAYGCNQSNSVGLAAYVMIARGVVYRCIAHDNSGSNSVGFLVGNQPTRFIKCIADTNGSHGFSSASGTAFTMDGCEAYNNGGDGLRHATSSNCLVNIESCNFVNNAGWGINVSSGSLQGYLFNNGFGDNTSGAKSGTGTLVESGAVTYGAGVRPWVDAPNGDFRINLASAKNAGRGVFTQTQASYTGTVGYPDIGAAQHLDSGGSSGPVGQLKQFNRGTPY